MNLLLRPDLSLASNFAQWPHTVLQSKKYYKETSAKLLIRHVKLQARSLMTLFEPWRFCICKFFLEQRRGQTGRNSIVYIHWQLNWEVNPDAPNWRLYQVINSHWTEKTPFLCQAIGVIAASTYNICFIAAVLFFCFGSFTFLTQFIFPSFNCWRACGWIY